MPTRPASHKPVSAFGSSRKQSQRTYDQARGPDRQWYGKPSWRRFRRWFLSQYPLCADCQERGELTEATEVHHVEKRKDNPDEAFNEDNCKSLCKGCHSSRTARGE